MRRVGRNQFLPINPSVDSVYNVNTKIRVKLRAYPDDRCGEYSDAMLANLLRLANAHADEIAKRQAQRGGGISAPLPAPSPPPAPPPLPVARPAVAD